LSGTPEPYTNKCLLSMTGGPSGQRKEVTLEIDREYLEDLFDAFPMETLSGRCLVAGSVIFPTAFCMGMPFPVMLERMRAQFKEHSAGLLLAANGAFSALGIMLAMYYLPIIGFRLFVLVAGFVYFLVAVIFMLETRREN